MFRAYNINNNTLSIRNMILLFLTIVMWFWAVITLGQISIPSSISNARQTIAHVTITETGINTAPLIDMSSTGIFIDTTILTPETNFSWKVLGIDDYGNVIYVLSESLVVSWVSAWGGGSGYWTGNGAHIYNINTGNVWIWTSIMSGKLHIKGSGETDVYIEETNPWNAANLNLKNTARTRALGGDSNPDLFYVGIAGWSRYLVIKPTGEVGIGTDNPDAKLQVIGNFMGGDINNTILGVNSSIWGWGTSLYPNNIIGNYSFIWWWIQNNNEWQYGFIWWWNTNTINWTKSSIIGWSNNTITWFWDVIAGWDQNTISWVSNFIWWWFYNTIDIWNRSVIVGGQSNTIKWGELSTIAGGGDNKIYTSQYSFIGWWENNRITGSNHSVIPWWQNNLIDSSEYSFAAGYYAQLKGTPNTFIRNSDTIQHQAGKPGTFIIYVPYISDGPTQKGGVGINTNYPRWDLHIAWQGLVVFEPQTNKGSTCDITWSVYYSTGYSQLCFCNGSDRRLVANPSTTCYIP